MALIGEMHYLTIGGNTYSIPISGGSTVTVTRSLTSGTKSATINVDGTDYDLYAPTAPTKTSQLTNDSNFLTSSSTLNAAKLSGAIPSAVTATTQTAGDSSTKLATTAFVTSAISALGSVLRYKGTKATVSALPTSGNTTGDVWHITADGSEYAWDGSAWQELGTAIDLSGYAQLAGASFTGPVTFGDAVTADELTTGDLVVNGSASFTNNINANTINGATVGSSPKFTDTVTTVSTSGSGNAVTAITASNGALTVTKGTTFLTSHQDISGKADKSATVSTVTWDSTNNKLTKTINGSTTDVVTLATIKTALGSMPASDVYSWAKASTKPTYTASEVGAATSTHTHGNITNAGDITATAPTIANGDQIVINDNSASKITNGPTFDGSTTTTALTPKGTWESFSKFSGSYNDLTNKPAIPTVPSKVSAFTNDAGYITSADVPEGASAYTGTISAVGTTASNGTNNGFARGDHVHNITSSTITSALGYTPYDSTNPNGYISSYTDEKLKWTASTTSNTYYPLQSTSTATTSTANTLNGISFYQYYNTAGGYRRLILGNSTAYTSTGGAYGTIRLYGTGATYYGDLNPGTLGANRTWTLPNATGTIALTSDIPDVSSFITDAGVTKITTTAGTHSAITNATGAVSFNVPTKTSHLTNDSNFVTSSGVTSITLKAGDGISLDTDNTAITTTGTRTISHADTSSQASSSNSGRTYIQSITLDTYGHVTGISTATESVTNTDTKLQVAAVTSGTTYYPIVGTGTTAATRQYDTTGFIYVGTNGTANGTNGNALLTLGNSTASTTANWKKGTVRLYGTTAYYTDLVSGAPSANRTITFPNATGTVALTSDIPTTLPASDVSAWAKAASKPTYTASEVGALASNTTYVSTVSTTAGTHSAISSKSGAVSFNVPTKTSHLTNDSGYITASHTSTYSLPLAASGTRGGVQIGYSESGTNYAVKLSSEKMYVSVPWTDTKVTTAALTSGTTYYPILATGTGTATRQIDSTLGSLKYTVTAGTTSAMGKAFLEIGNNIASGTANNVKGILKIYGANSTAYLIDAQSETTASEVTLTLPDAGGTLLSSGCLNYTTSGNNRAVQRDSNGNLYVTQKDDNTNTFKSFYGTCETAAATAAKVVTLSTTTGWQLAAGTIVGVKFTNTNTYSATSSSHVTLNVNSTGAKNICYGSALPTGTNTTAFGRANYINYYMYDGSQWVWLSSSADNDTNNYVNQLANSSAAWRKVLGTHSSGTYVTSTITDNDNHVVYYDADGPAFNTSTGELYTKGYYMYLATTDALYTAIDGLGWTSEVIS